MFSLVIIHIWSKVFFLKNKSLGLRVNYLIFNWPYRPIVFSHHLQNVGSKFIYSIYIFLYKTLWMHVLQNRSIRNICEFSRFFERRSLDDFYGHEYKMSILGRKPISKRCLEIGFRSSIAGTRQSIHFLESLHVAWSHTKSSPSHFLPDWRILIQKLDMSELQKIILSTPNNQVHPIQQLINTQIGSLSVTLRFYA